MENQSRSFDESHDEELQQQQADYEVVGVDSVRAYLGGIGRVGLLGGFEAEAELSQQIEAGLYAAQILAVADGLSAFEDIVSVRETTAIQLSKAGQIDVQTERNTFRRKLSARVDACQTDAAHRNDLEVLRHDGEAAKQHMIEANLRLVVSIVKRYERPSSPLLDVIQDGNFGLMHAIEKYDYKKGWKFSTYATWWIRQSALRGIADKERMIRVPVHAVEHMQKIKLETEKYLAETGEHPSHEQLVEITGLKLVRIAELTANRLREPASLDSPVGTESEIGASTLGDFVADKAAASVTEATAMYNDLKTEIASAISQHLSGRERQVIILRYGLSGRDPMNLAQVGKFMDFSRETIRKIELSAIQILKASPQFDSLRDYIP